MEKLSLIQALGELATLSEVCVEARARCCEFIDTNPVIAAPEIDFVPAGADPLMLPILNDGLLCQGYNRQRAAAVTPQEIGGAVAAEIADLRDLPGSIERHHRWDRQYPRSPIVPCLESLSRIEGWLGRH
jgi:hypothetical protein